MCDTDPESREHVARLAAEAGAAVALSWWRRLAELTIEEKAGPSDLVSVADREAEKAVRSVLERECPDDGILGEEFGSVGGATGIEWVVDPIDGTTNFLYGRSDWAVSVAAVRSADRAVLAGAVAEPALNSMTVAHRGGGTRHNGHRTSVSITENLHRALVETNLGRGGQRAQAGAMVDSLVPRTRDVRRGGSAACALAQVATRRVDAVWAPGLSVWDYAAGMLLVHEAGGIVGDLTGPTAALCPVDGDVLAANDVLWPQLATILRPVYV